MSIKIKLVDKPSDPPKAGEIWYPGPPEKGWILATPKGGLIMEATSSGTITGKPPNIHCEHLNSTGTAPDLNGTGFSPASFWSGRITHGELVEE